MFVGAHRGIYRGIWGGAIWGSIGDMGGPMEVIEGPITRLQ